MQDTVPYGPRFKTSDKADIPARDLPPGIPAWMYDDDGWVPKGVIPEI
jgi:hypothetical protein